MPIIDLGTNSLEVGGNPGIYIPISFKDDKAYLIKGLFTSSSFNNIFSYVRIRAKLSIPGQPVFWAATFVELEILPEPFSFFYPFSSLYDGAGTAQFFAERVSFRPFFFRGEATATLKLFYDNKKDTATWF